MNSIVAENINALIRGVICRSKGKSSMYVRKAHEIYLYFCLTLPLPLVLSHQAGEVGWPVPFLLVPVSPSRPLFTAGWTVNKRTNLRLRCVSNNGSFVQLAPILVINMQLNFLVLGDILGCERNETSPVDECKQASY